MTKLIPLDSERWDELDYNSVRGSLTEQLAILRKGKSRKLCSEALDNVVDQIFHQMTTCEATWVAVPHLVDVFDQQHSANKFGIARLVGFISLERGSFPKILNNDEISLYRKSLVTAASKLVEFLKHDLDKDTDAVLTLLCAICGLGGNRKLGNRLFNHSEEEFHDCGNCRAQLLRCCYCVHASEDLCADDYLRFGIRANTGDYATPVQHLAAGRPVTLRQDFSSDAKAMELVDLCERNGHPKCGKWLRGFLGSCTCPKCGTEVSFLSPGR